MTRQVTDSNINTIDFNSFECGILDYSHSNYLRFNYKAPASIKYVHTGCINYLINGRTIQLKSGEYLFVNSGVEVQTTIPQSSTGFAIFLGSDMNLDRLIPAFPILDSIMIRNIENLKGSVSEDSQQIILAVYAFIESYLNQLNKNCMLLSLKTRSAKLDVLKKLYSARLLIERQKKSCISIDHIAEESFLSKYELIRRFKEVFGITPYKYFQHQKIEASKRDLLNGKTLSEIANEYEIADIHTYSKLFKKITGFTPSEFRSGHIQTD